MRVLLVIALLVAVALAGCADGSATNAEDEDEFDDIETRATSTTGVIRGVVFDAAIVPIAGAKVQIKSLEEATESSENGAFAFQDLEPGTYFVEVSKSGYDRVQTSVSVEAGVDKPPIVKVQLAANPSTAPVAVPYVFDGFIQCSVVVIAVAYAACSQPQTAGVDLGDEFLQYVEVNGYPDFVQGELLWETTQSLGEALAFSVFDGSLTAPRRAEGVSPLIISGDRGFWENGTGSDKSGSPMVNEGERLAWRVFAGAHSATSGVVWGVGVTFEQRFSIYTHAFYNWVPEEGWLFIEHGEPEMPS